MDEREAMSIAVKESESLERYLSGNVDQWLREHIYPQVIADWVGGVETWEQTVDHFLDKYKLLVEVRENLKKARRRLEDLEKEARLPASDDDGPAMAVDDDLLPDDYRGPDGVLGNDFPDRWR